MEIILKKEEKVRIAEILDFVKSLSEEEARDFSNLVKGYKLAKGMEGKQSA